MSKKLLLDTGANALFVRSVTNVDKALLAGTNVRFVGTATAGTEHVDTHYLQQKGIAFASAPGSNAMAVAEYVLQALFSWSKKTQQSLEGKRLGIIGLGNVGKRVALVAHQLGMNIIASDPSLEALGISPLEFVEWKNYRQLLALSDCITFHVPYCVEGLHPTVNLFDESCISAIHNQALVIQTSRGGIVNEQALLRCMNDNAVYAAIDVWTQEPLWNEELVNHANTLMATPHIAGYTHQARERGVDMILDEYVMWKEMKGEKKNRINEGIECNNSAVQSLLVNNRFNAQRCLRLKGLHANKEEFDKARREFMNDQETLKDVLLG